MLHTLFERITHALQFTTMLRREMRRGMHTIYDNLQKFESEVKPSLDHAKDAGDVDAIQKGERTAEDLLLDHGEKLDIDIEIDAQMVQLRIEDKLDGMVKFLAELSDAITRAQRRGVLPPAAAQKLRREVTQATADLHAMYNVMVEACANEYRALLEESRAATDGRSAEEHWMEVRARGFARLSRAMHEVFQLPKEQRSIAREVADFERVDTAVIQMLDHMHANAQGIAKDFERVEKSMTQLVRGVRVLVEHVKDVFLHLTEIMRVFVMYFFLIQHAKGDMDAFFAQLKTWQFPEKTLVSMKASYDKKVKEITSATGSATAIAQRSRRGPQDADALLRKVT